MIFAKDKETMVWKGIFVLHFLSVTFNNLLIAFLNAKRKFMLSSAIGIVNVLIPLLGYLLIYFHLLPMHSEDNYLYAVLFVGIRNGKQDCDVRPILNAPNIRESKAEYFNVFFKDGGEYLKFVSNEDKSFGKIERARARDGEFMFGFVTRVMRSELKKQMIKDGILN